MITSVQDYSNWYNLTRAGKLAKPNKQEPYIPINLDTRSIDMSKMSQLGSLGVLGDDKAETIWFECDRYFDAKDLMETSIAIVAKNANPTPVNGDNEFLITGIEKTGHSSDSSDTEDKIHFAWILTEPIMRFAGTVTFSIKFFNVSLDGQYEYSLNTKPAQFTVHNGLRVNDDEAKNRLPFSATDWETFSQKVDLLFGALAGTDDEYEPDKDGNILISRSYNALSDRPVVIVNGKEVVFEGKKKASDYGFSLPETYLDEAHIGDEFTDVAQNKIVSKTALDKRFKEVEEKVKTLEETSPFDTVVTKNSTKGATSGAIWKAIEEKKIDVDSELNEESNNPISNSIVATEINKLKEEMGTLTYVPLTVDKFEITDPYQEIGAERKTVQLSWKLSKVPNELYINDVMISPDTTSYQIDTAVKSDVRGETIDYVLKAVTKDITTATAQLLFTESIRFDTLPAQKTAEDYDGNFIATFANKLIQPTKECSIDVDANKNEYIFIGIPAAYGVPTFNVGGFEGGFEKITEGAGVSFRRNSVASNYHIYKSINPSLGSTTIQVY